MNPTLRILTLSLSILAASFASAADYPAPVEGDFIIRNFKFTSGEMLPEACPVWTRQAKRLPYNLVVCPSILTA